MKKILLAIMALVSLAPNLLLAQDKDSLTPKEKQGMWGYVSQEGKEIISFRYEKALAFSEGLAAVKLNGKWGFINESGNIVIKMMYDDADSFSEGLAAVCNGEKTGFIDRDGKVVIPLKYETKISKSSGGVTSTQTLSAPSFTFDKGVAQVVLNGKFGLIDKNDRVIAAFRYDEIDKFSDKGKALVEVDGEIKHIDLTGTEMEVKSNWPQMPVLFNDGRIKIVDMIIGMVNDKTAVTLYGKGINPFGSMPTIGPRGLEMPKTPSVSILVGETEYLSKESAVGGLNRTYYFETNKQPDSVIIFMADTPNSKVSIKCENK